MESLSTDDYEARTPSRIARNDTEIDDLLSTLTASNLAAHDMQMERLASTGISPSSTISRSRTSPAARRAIEEDADTVILTERAQSV